MSVVKHTDGEWSIDVVSSPFIDGAHMIESDGKCIAHVEGWEADPQSKEEALANARLMAAAPVMYEALKLLVDNALDRGEFRIENGEAVDENGLWEEWDSALKAITKATSG